MVEVGFSLVRLRGLALGGFGFDLFLGGREGHPYGVHWHRGRCGMAGIGRGNPCDCPVWAHILADVGRACWLAPTGMVMTIPYGRLSPRVELFARVGARR